MMLLIMLIDAFVGPIGDQCPPLATLIAVLPSQIATQHPYVAAGGRLGVRMFVARSGGGSLVGSVVVVTGVVQVYLGQLVAQ